MALLVFGPKKLPELGKSLGRGLAEFKRASDDLKKTIEDEIEIIQRFGHVGDVDRPPTGLLGADEIGGEVVEIQDLVGAHAEHLGRQLPLGPVQPQGGGGRVQLVHGGRNARDVGRAGAT